MHVITELVKMHKPIQALKTIHMGGDEVSRKSWTESPICQNFIKENGLLRYNAYNSYNT